MWHGVDQRVSLDVDLTRYHEHLVRGTKGTLLPGVQTTEWGSNDRFGAVSFDCCDAPGATLDIVLANLTFLDIEKEPVVPEGDREALSAELDDLLAGI